SAVGVPRSARTWRPGLSRGPSWLKADRWPLIAFPQMSATDPSQTPMMQQYRELKARDPDALLLFRMGDFYEMFGEDAERAGALLGLAVTSRDKGPNAIPMAGFPHPALETYLARLVALGQRAAVCEQVEDAKLAKGLVRRDVVRVVTPGTLTD